MAREHKNRIFGTELRKANLKMQSQFFPHRVEKRLRCPKRIESRRYEQGYMVASSRRDSNTSMRNSRRHYRANYSSPMFDDQQRLQK
eukprot:scaffold133000_cov46-Attheya_sp.AAC.1